MCAARSSHPRARVAEVVIRHRHTGLLQLGSLDLFRLGGPAMPMRIRQSDLLHFTMGQLTLLTAAVIVLLFFAWTYLD